MSKLDLRNVIRIKDRLKAGKSMKDIADEFGVSDTTVRKIRDGKIWKDIAA